jgi:hypothetical protein
MTSAWLNLPSMDSTRPRMRPVVLARRTNLPEWEALDLSAFDAVGQAGEIVAFSYQPPTLSELFRQAVAA